MQQKSKLNIHVNLSIFAKAYCWEAVISTERYFIWFLLCFIHIILYSHQFCDTGNCLKIFMNPNGSYFFCSSFSINYSIVGMDFVKYLWHKFTKKKKIDFVMNLWTNCPSKMRFRSWFNSTKWFFYFFGFF